MSSPITTHVLDTTRGLPAQGIPVQLEARRGGNWEILSKSLTNADGRVNDLLKAGLFDHGTYRLTFDTAEYFKAHKTKSFYPIVEITFEVSENRHYHVPLLLSAFGYSTYRGS